MLENFLPTLAYLYIYNYQLPFSGESLYKSRSTYDASESMTDIGTVFATASEFFEKNNASHFIYELQAAKVGLASGTDLRARVMHFRVCSRLYVFAI